MAVDICAGCPLEGEGNPKDFLHLYEASTSRATALCRVKDVHFPILAQVSPAFHQANGSRDTETSSLSVQVRQIEFR